MSLRILAFALILISAFCTRLLPLSISQYPFNNDSLTECGMASEILDSGRLEFSSESSWYGSHSVDIPALNLVLAFISSVFGVSPLQCAQLLIAVVSLVTVGAVYLLGRMMSRSHVGGIVAGLTSVLMGTFVFATGSVWKESLGLCLVILLVTLYLKRDRLRYVSVVIAILFVLPLVHHLATAVSLLILVFLLVRSWHFALSKNTLRRRHWNELLVVSGAIVWAVGYYLFTSLDRLSLLTTGATVLLLPLSFGILVVLSVLVESIKTHSGFTYAPLVGVGVFSFVVVDYLGYVFPYSPSAPSYYLILAGVSAFFVGIAWYGAEIAVEVIRTYCTVQIGLLVAPATVVGVGIVGGFSGAAHQIVFRSFDFLDIFVFVGIAVALATMQRKRKRSYTAIGFLITAALMVSFPFAYYSDPLLGVRHDTQGYEVDTISWVSDADTGGYVVSDERIAYIAMSMFGYPKSSYLPSEILKNTSLTEMVPGSYFLFEMNWVTGGVNDYPRGKVTIPASNFTLAIESGNSLYVGGPPADHIIVAAASSIGYVMVYP